MKPAITPQQDKFTGSVSSLEAYRELVCKNSSLPFFLYYEATTLLSGIPGLLGFGLRTIFYPPLFQKCGKRIAIGKGTLLRNTKLISIASKFLCDDYAVLDVHGDGGSINIGSFVSLGRFSTLAAKGGRILIGDGVNIGSHCRIATQTSVEIGESVLVAAYCYIGPGNHKEGDGGEPLISSEMNLKSGVKIGKHAWIGAHSTIMDGVNIGERAIVAAHSFVNSNVEPGAIVGGVPAREISKVS